MDNRRQACHYTPASVGRPRPRYCRRARGGAKLAGGWGWGPRCLGEGWTHVLSERAGCEVHPCLSCMLTPDVGPLRPRRLRAACDTLAACGESRGWRAVSDIGYRGEGLWHLPHPSRLHLRTRGVLSQVRPAILARPFRSGSGNCWSVRACARGVRCESDYLRSAEPNWSVREGRARGSCVPSVHAHEVCGVRRNYANLHGTKSVVPSHPSWRWCVVSGGCRPVLVSIGSRGRSVVR